MVRKSSYLFALVIAVGGFAWLNAAPATADDIALKESKALVEEKNAEPRYRLREDGIENALLFPIDQTKPEFSWEAITGKGPAAGSDPVIGDQRIQSFYDFRDGNPAPFFFVKID